MKAYTYMLRCADGTLYTGWTTDPAKRLAAHNSENKGAKYTKIRRPCEMVYCECFEDEDPTAAKKAAMRREWEIKHKLTKLQQEALICAQEKCTPEVRNSP